MNQNQSSSDTSFKPNNNYIKANTIAPKNKTRLINTLSNINLSKREQAIGTFLKKKDTVIQVSNNRNQTIFPDINQQLKNDTKIKCVSDRPVGKLYLKKMEIMQKDSSDIEDKVLVCKIRKNDNVESKYPRSPFQKNNTSKIFCRYKASPDTKFFINKKSLFNDDFGSTDAGDKSDLSSKNLVKKKEPRKSPLFKLSSTLCRIYSNNLAHDNNLSKECNINNKSQTKRSATFFYTSKKNNTSLLNSTEQPIHYNTLRESPEKKIDKNMTFFNNGTNNICLDKSLLANRGHLKTEENGSCNNIQFKGKLIKKGILFSEKTLIKKQQPISDRNNNLNNLFNNSNRFITIANTDNSNEEIYLNNFERFNTTKRIRPREYYLKNMKSRIKNALKEIEIDTKAQLIEQKMNKDSELQKQEEQMIQAMQQKYKLKKDFCWRNYNEQAEKLQKVIVDTKLFLNKNNDRIPQIPKFLKPRMVDTNDFYEQDLNQIINEHASLQKFHFNQILKNVDDDMLTVLGSVSKGDITEEQAEKQLRKLSPGMISQKNTPRKSVTTNDFKGINDFKNKTANGRTLNSFHDSHMDYNQFSNRKNTKSPVIKKPRLTKDEKRVIFEEFINKNNKTIKVQSKSISVSSRHESKDKISDDTSIQILDEKAECSPISFPEISIPNLENATNNVESPSKKYFKNYDNSNLSKSVIDINYFKNSSQKKMVFTSIANRVADPFSIRPSRFTGKATGKPQKYYSYWLQCIANVMKADLVWETKDIGYYDLYAMDMTQVKYVTSYKHGGAYKNNEIGEDFHANENMYRLLYTLWKRIDYDIYYDNKKFNCHVDKDELLVMEYYDEYDLSPLDLPATKYISTNDIYIY